MDSSAVMALPEANVIPEHLEESKEDGELSAIIIVSDDEANESVEFVSETAASGEAKQIARLNQKLVDLKRQIGKNKPAEVKKKFTNTSSNEQEISSRQAASVIRYAHASNGTLVESQPDDNNYSNLSDSFIERTVQDLIVSDDAFCTFMNAISQ